nr:unnamed protein product [Spirometra erinaceieuropaei]
MVGSGHRGDPIEAFRVIYKVTPNYPKRLSQRFLETAEATAIRLQRPVLCAVDTKIDSDNDNDRELEREGKEEEKEEEEEEEEEEGEKGWEEEEEVSV